MFSIIEWQEKDFLNRDNYEALQKQVQDFLFYAMENEAYHLFNELSKKSDLIDNINDENLKDSYKKNIQVLKFISLPRLSDELVLNIFKEELAEMLNFNQEELDIKDKIRRKLANILLVDRDKYKEQLIKSLEENEQIITQGKLETADEEKEGSVRNWIKEYYKFIVESNIDKKLIKAEFLFKNKNVARLTDKDKQKLEIILDLYDDWHKSSLTVAGNEDPLLVDYKGQTYLVYNGEISEIDGKNNLIDANQIKTQLTKTVLVNKPTIERKDKILATENVVSRNINEQQDIEYKNAKEELQVKWQKFLSNWLMVETMEEVEKIKQKDDYEMSKIRSKFYHAVNQRATQDALAALFIIAEQGNIGKAFGADERFQNFWGDYLEKNNLGAKQFKNNPAEAKYLAMFFKYIMEERLKLDEEDTVMMGAVLANLCRQAQEMDYQQMAYGDVESGEFKWNV